MSRRTRRVAAMLAAAAATAATAAAVAAPSFAGDPQTLYVFADGDDSASCLTPHAACRTIQAALAKAGGSGDTIEVGAGTYSGDVTVAVPVRIVNYPGDSPQLTGAVDVGAAGGDVTVEGLTFTGTGGITVTANAGATTLADNVFSGVTATAIQLIGPGAAPAMAVTLDGNRGTVTPPAQTVTETGAVAVTALTPDTITWPAPAPAIVTAGAPVHVVPHGPAQDLAALTVPDNNPSLSNAEYDIAITSSETIDASEVSVSDDVGNVAGLTGDTAPGDTLTGSLPVPSGPDTRTLTVAATGGAPSTLTVAISLVEYDQHQVPLNRVALATATVTIAVNSRPIAQPATARWRCNSGPHSLQLHGADPDGGDVTFHTAAAPAHGRVHVDAGTGVAGYTPDKDFVGTDSFTYTVVDSTGLRSAPAAVRITMAKATTRIAATALSPARPTTAQHPTLTVRVTSAGRTADGIVAVDTGAGIRTARVGRNGTAALSLPGLSGGTHRISVVFRGTSTAQRSATRTVRFTVTRVASSLSVRTDPAAITTRTKHAVAVVTISAGTFHVSSGQVRIDEVLADGTRRELASGTPRAGSVTLHLPRFSLGQHNLAITFGGTAQVAPSATTLVERVPLS